MSRMRDLETAKLTALVTLGVSVYYLPTFIAVARYGGSGRRVGALNTVVGWTIAGWIWALILALRPAAQPPPARTDPPDAGTRAEPERFRLYEDGSYLISQAGCARTWAVCVDGRWGVVYELDEIQRAATWLEPEDIPFDVLARALHDTREARR